MALLDDILSAGSGGAVGQIAAKLGIPDDLARQAASVLTPALSRGIERNTQKPGGLDSLLGALSSGDHQKYVDEPETIGREASIEDGNKILGHVLGNKDVSRNVAGAASAKTGIDAGTLKKMLPMLATVAMGALSKKTASPGGPSSGLTGGAGSNPLNALQSMGGLGALTQFLDADKDGNATDELLDMAKK